MKQHLMAPATLTVPVVTSSRAKDVTFINTVNHRYKAAYGEAAPARTALTVAGLFNDPG